MQTAVRWLPDCELKSKSTLGAIGRCLASWSDEWVSLGQVKLAEDWRKNPLSGNSVEAGKKRGVRLMCPPDPEHRLASMLLNKKLKPKDIKTDSDLELVSCLRKKALADLLETLVAELSSGSDGKEQPDEEMDVLDVALIADKGVELIIVSIDRSVLSKYAFKNSPMPRVYPAPVALNEAIQKQHISLRALVGRTSIELADVIEIDLGDVLVLDRLVSQSLDLMIGDKTIGHGCASMSLGNDCLALSIESTPNQW